MFLARQGKGDLFLPQQQKKDFPDTKKTSPKRSSDDFLTSAGF